MFSLSLGQAEQYRKKEVKVKMFMEKGFHNVVKPILDNSLQKEAWDILVEPDSLPPKKSSNTHKKFPKKHAFYVGNLSEIKFIRNDVSIMGRCQKHPEEGGPSISQLKGEKP